MQRPHINVFPSIDTDGKTYYVGRMKAPVTFNLKSGMAFLFYPDLEVPELHFCPLDSPDISDAFKYYEEKREVFTKAKHGNLPIPLQVRFDQNSKKKFYIGKVKIDARITAEKGVVFLVFTADPGEEELQIASFNPEKIRKQIKK